MPKVSQDHLDGRRRAIVEAARGVFAQKGFSGASMAAVIEATGLSTGTFYRYFPSKAALVAEIVSGRDGTEGGEFPAGETPDELLRRLMSYVTPPGATAEHARLVVQIWAEASTSPMLAAIAVRRHTSLRDHLAGLYAANRPDGAPGGEPTAAEKTRAEAALAALIGYATLAAVEAPAGFPDLGDRIAAAFA
ncbi:TetR/AcrR family transcriptional regulator [Streptomyces sp. 8L]|uniref:TetR/AcrR family transcriptional regulator n=1 Tax=Streptomyces sp. 8L TaxID=2877242 RepID=UPI001CD4564C|nr:TetR/AcrR family transcriptional regulator [Streptomyces sp. 8L]MCA1218808.1 TetR/AcrR family transcriptional regulator [Streptomyces sp. 8L]